MAIKTCIEAVGGNSGQLLSVSTLACGCLLLTSGCGTRQKHRLSGTDGVVLKKKSCNAFSIQERGFESGQTS